MIKRRVQRPAYDYGTVASLPMSGLFTHQDVQVYVLVAKPPLPHPCTHKFTSHGQGVAQVLRQAEQFIDKHRSLILDVRVLTGLTTDPFAELQEQHDTAMAWERGLVDRHVSDALIRVGRLVRTHLRRR